MDNRSDARGPRPVLIATDLDRTLVFSPRATAMLGGGLPAHPVEILDGTVIGEMADIVAESLRGLPRHVTFIPTTTRTGDQLARLALPVAPRFMIAASGGIVFEHGRPDAHWTSVTRQRLARVAPAAQVRSVLDALVVRGSLLRAYTAEDMFCYAIVEPVVFPAGAISALEAVVTPLGWRVEHQDRKLYVLPHGLCKAGAVRYVAAKVQAETGSRPRVLAAGDTRLDWEMLNTADRGWVPRGSELDLAAVRAEHVTVTSASGHRAAAHITAAWLADIHGGDTKTTP